MIERTRDGHRLTSEEIKFIIHGCADCSIADFQVSVFLMAVVYHVMTDEEFTQMTFAMFSSCEIVDLSTIEGIKVDKHSTGGVG
ncbi:pyrimidine-nucleoside phosphorylase, partial [Enterococcus faecalis]|nr:pyrimidine-nucleoside phosphorylase [Enterococcus faecalis]